MAWLVFIGWVIPHANEWEDYSNYFGEGAEISWIGPPPTPRSFSSPSQAFALALHPPLLPEAASRAVLTRRNQGSELDHRPGPTAPSGYVGPAAPTPIAFLDLVLLTGPHGGCGANELGSGEWRVP